VAAHLKEYDGIHRGKTDRGEVGVLKDCHAILCHALQSDVGALVVDDLVFCQQLFSVLPTILAARSKRLGRSICLTRYKQLYVTLTIIATVADVNDERS
jgi:hypothetical protein